MNVLLHQRSWRLMGHPQVSQRGARLHFRTGRLWLRLCCVGVLRGLGDRGRPLGVVRTGDCGDIRPHAVGRRRRRDVTVPSNRTWKEILKEEQEKLEEERSLWKSILPSIAKRQELPQALPQDPLEPPAQLQRWASSPVLREPQPVSVSFILLGHCGKHLRLLLPKPNPQKEGPMCADLQVYRFL